MNTTLLLMINGWAGHNVWLDALMVFFAKWAIFGVALATLAVLVYYAYERQWRTVSFFLLNLAVAFICLEIAARFHLDHRPFMDHHLTQLMTHAPGNSFPSDHTTASTALAFSVLFFTRFKWFGWLLLVVALVIGFARVFVGVHYPLDIVGAVGTSLLAVLITLLVRRMTTPRHRMQLGGGPNIKS